MLLRCDPAPGVSQTRWQVAGFSLRLLLFAKLPACEGSLDDAAFYCPAGTGEPVRIQASVFAAQVAAAFAAGRLPPSLLRHWRGSEHTLSRQSFRIVRALCVACSPTDRFSVSVKTGVERASTPSLRPRTRGPNGYGSLSRRVRPGCLIYVAGRRVPRCKRSKSLQERTLCIRSNLLRA
jgi:hypothetical protein